MNKNESLPLKLQYDDSASVIVVTVISYFASFKLWTSFGAIG